MVQAAELTLDLKMYHNHTKGLSGSVTLWFIITSLTLHQLLWATGHAVNKHVYLFSIREHKGKIDISAVRFIMV